jgi:pyrimidine-nucleoside phosphorylase
MRAVDIITRKRDRHELSTEEIQYFVSGYARGQIPDYQASAWAMAVLLNGMTARETTDLTLAMAASGQTLAYPASIPVVVDKHSTGGVGDKTSLVAAPLVAACGLPVGKMSGRGLGFSGGTLDKLESIPGYRCDLTTAQFFDQLQRAGIVLTGQSADLAPADGRLYALRDVTGTVPSIPLIASSVMSKKIAAGAQAMVLDVKVGNGAFMETLDNARTLARLMVDIARLASRRAIALLSDMNQPLGLAVGNALEVKEAMATLAGGGPPDFREHCLTVAAHMLLLGGICSDEAEARRVGADALASGRAFQKFRLLVHEQGGDVSYVDDPARFPPAAQIETVHAARSGWLSRIHARAIGEAAVLLGAGRAQKGDPVDHAVGIEIFHKVGQRVEAGEPLFTVHANSPGKLAETRPLVEAAFGWSDTPAAPLPLFYEVIA